MADIHDEICRRLGLANAVRYRNVKGFAAPLALVYYLEDGTPRGALLLERTDGKLFRADRNRWWSAHGIQDNLKQGAWVMEWAVIDPKRIEDGPPIRDLDDMRWRA